MKYLKEKAWRTCEYYKHNSNEKQVGEIKNELSENLASRYIDKVGREYLDVPAIIIGQQVLHGAGGYEFGAELVTEKALVQSANQWNNIPVVIYHTSESARTIDNLENEKVGFIYNAEVIGYDEDPSNIRLKCMLRLDVGLLKLHEDGDMIINTFDSGNIMEMSTGYFVIDWQWQEGSFRGRDYVAMQNELIPDHLALLPNAVGAYSIDDGGGANRENEGESMKDSDKKEFVALMEETIETKLNEILNDRLKEVPTTENISDMVGELEKKIDDKLAANEAKEEEVVVNEDREALVLKVMEKGFTREELEGTSDKILEHMAKEEEKVFVIPHEDLNKNTESETMNDPDFQNKETK